MILLDTTEKEGNTDVCQEDDAHGEKEQDEEHGQQHAPRVLAPPGLRRALLRGGEEARGGV